MNNPSTAHRASPAEVNALLELIKLKPPPKVDGLVAFTADLRTQYAPEERTAILESSSGAKLLEALGRCDGINKQMRQMRNEWMNDRDNKVKRNKLREFKVKYVECLTYIACPMRWKGYTQCWSNLSRLNMEELQRIQDFGPELACKYERQLVEQCVGSLVAGAIRAADTVRSNEGHEIEVDV